MDYSPFFIGQTDLEVRDGSYTPLRFTQAQLDSLKHSNHPDAVAVRINCTAGVRLEFSTDADEISFCFACDNFARAHVVFDIYENGTYIKSATFEDNTQSGSVTYHRTMSARSTITIWLPHLVRTRVFDISIGDAQPVERSERRLLFYGDSLTQGMTSPRPSFSWASLVAGELSMDFMNFGIGGKKFDPDVLDFENSYNPHTVVVAYGINDSIQEENAPLMQANVPEFFSSFDSIYKGCDVYVITAPRITGLCTDPTVSNHLDSVRRLTQLEAEKYGYTVVDGLKLLPQNPDFIADDDHPNELGCAHIANQLVKAMQKSK